MQSLPHEIYKYFNRWESLNKQLDILETKECFTKDEFEKKENEILLNTDFKEIYGQNNEKIRKNHVKEELSDLYNKKNKLKLEIAQKQRELQLTKCLTEAKIKYMR